MNMKICGLDSILYGRNYLGGKQSNSMLQVNFFLQLNFSFLNKIVTGEVYLKQKDLDLS